MPIVESELDRQIMASVTSTWQEVAMVIGSIVSALPDAVANNVAVRIEKLVDLGRLELSGDLRNWRASEIRIRHSSASTEPSRRRLSVVKSAVPPADVARTDLLSERILFPRETITAQSNDEQKKMLKARILLWKDRGYVTRAEIAESFPEMIDAERISAISDTFGDMGIQVVDDLPGT